MEKKKVTTKKAKVEQDTIILDGNVEVQPKNLGTFEDNKNTPAPEQKPTPAPQVKRPIQVVELPKLSDEYKKLRPEGIYEDDETAAQMGDRLQKKADEYKKELEGHSDLDALNEMEKEWIEKLETMDKYLEQVKYVLPKSTQFNGKAYPKGAVAGKIVRFISTKEVQFPYTLGMYQLCKLWDADPRELSYPEYNATLETLGTLNFKGLREWEDILVVNEFFSATNKEYAKDLTAYQYLSTMHSHLVGRIQMLDPNAAQKNQPEPEIQ